MDLRTVMSPDCFSPSQVKKQKKKKREKVKSSLKIGNDAGGTHVIFQNNHHFQAWEIIILV